MTAEGNDDHYKKSDKFNDTFVENSPVDEVTFWNMDDEKETEDAENNDNFSDDEISDLVAKSDILVKFRNAGFTWGMKDDFLLEIEDLEIPQGNVYLPTNFLPFTYLT